MENFTSNVLGASSTVAISSDIYQPTTSPVDIRKAGSTSAATRRIDEHSGIDALLNPTTAVTEDYAPRRPLTSEMDNITNKHIAERHLTNYFATIHTMIPVLHENSFRALYNGYWSRLTRRSTSSTVDSNLQKITAPLVYSVLALGALYEDGHSDHAFWAKEWFAKAREGISNVAEECCFEICLAVYFVVTHPSTDEV